MSNMENLNPAVMKRISKELAELTKEPLDGVKVHINEANITDIQATIEGPSDTPYAGGQFRIKLSLSDDFPASPPKGYFLTKVFHPNVATPSGEICVNTLKRDWKADLGIKHILLTVKCLLMDPNPESALNEEAGRLILEDYQSYSKKAKMYTSIHAMVKSASCKSGDKVQKQTKAQADAKKRLLKRL